VRCLFPACARGERPAQRPVSSSHGRQIGTTTVGAGIIYSVIEEPTNPLDGGPSACPFVAFEDDRDHRSDAPDYRHRCFAAPEPEPRAFPHQERYCLSDGFAACPIFLDWARQEAAGVKSAAAPAVIAASAAVDDTADADSGPAFLASRPRSTAAEGANAAGKRTSDASAGLWSYDAETKRTSAPPAPLPPSSLGAPAVAMARRGPTHPGWENPPRLESFPRLRSRDDRRANQPLFIAAVFIAAIMVALVIYPFVFSSNHGSTAPGSGSPAPVGSGASQGPSASSSQGMGASASPRFSFLTYVVKSGDYLAKIAGRFNLTLYEIEAANPQISDFEHIQVGWPLNIPPAGYFTPPPAVPLPANT
jgi:LysM repeat protein